MNCRHRLYEYLFFCGVWFLWIAVGAIIWVVSAYSLVAAFALLVGLPLLLLLPAIFLPMFSRRTRVWLSRWRARGLLHKFDWNIIWGLAAVLTSCMGFILIMFSPSLWWAWTHTVVIVPSNATYESMQSGAAYRFEPDWFVNTTAMGQQSDIACDDQGCVTYYHCFAPILPKNQTQPNLFWAMCPYNRDNCTASASQVACMLQWTADSVKSGVVFAADQAGSLQGPIAEVSEKFDLLPTPPYYLVIRWEDIDQIYARALFFFVISVGCGHGIIFLWLLVRRLILPCFCGGFLNPEYKQLH